MDKWVYNLSDNEVWIDCEEMYNSREECISDAIDRCLEENINSFYIGKAIPYQRPKIDVVSVIYDLEEMASQQLPYEIAEEMYSTDQKALNDLEDRFEKVFDEWCKENNINPSNSFIITDKEEIIYCAYCKKELTEQDEKMKILCPRDGEELWFYFHKDCDYILIDDLVPALAGDSI